MFAMDGFFVKESQLGDVAWQKSVQEPVRDQPHLAVESGKFSDVNAAPEHPGDKSREMNAKHLGDR